MEFSKILVRNHIRPAYLSRKPEDGPLTWQSLDDGPSGSPREPLSRKLCTSSRFTVFPGVEMLLVDGSIMEGSFKERSLPCGEWKYTEPGAEFDGIRLRQRGWTEQVREATQTRGTSEEATRSEMQQVAKSSGRCFMVPEEEPADGEEEKSWDTIF